MLRVYAQCLPPSLPTVIIERIVNLMLESDMRDDLVHYAQDKAIHACRFAHILPFLDLSHGHRVYRFKGPSRRLCSITGPSEMMAVNSQAK